MRPLTLAVAATAALLLAAPLLAQQPSVVHAQLTTEAAPAGPADALARLARSGQTGWIAYTIPTAQPFHAGGGTGDIAYLEGGHTVTSSHYDANTPSQDHALLLMRVAAHHLTQLRVEDPTRTLDASGLPLLYLSNVTPEASLASLRQIALDPGTAENARQLRDSAVFLISIHRSPSTLPTLSALTGPNLDRELREKAAFWIGTSPDPAAFPILRQLARTDGDARFRQALTFDLTLVKQPNPAQSDALSELVRMAHADPEPEVRKQAQFWMGTLGGQRVTADLRASAESDPNADVRNSAVFALSRLPAAQATPELIHVAQTSPSTETRKQAVFWLGQSNDPKALDFLTDLLKH